jgi:predicted SprT family Zn-dependent metalloprotease
VAVADRVAFRHRNCDYYGYVQKKGRKYAYIVCDDNSECKVPYALLSKIAGAPKRHVQSRSEKLRLQFHVNDRVEFTFKRQTYAGIITRLNPKRAHVVSDHNQEFQVPYEILTLIQPAQEQLSHSVLRDEHTLREIAARAQELLHQHRLKQWSFQFDYGTRRAGSCQYDKHIITMSYDYAKQASDEEIQDTLLHEIAHALVGKKHNHDRVWRAKALEIGCSGNRCHDRQFTPPRYIMKCANGCWVATAERRRRNLVCKRCHAKIQYLTYTTDRWQQEQASHSPQSPL